MSLASPLLPTKAILFPSGLQAAVNIPSKSNVSFSLFPFSALIRKSASLPPAFVAKTILSPSGDQEIPGCKSFSSSKSGVLLPLTKLFNTSPLRDEIVITSE